MCPIGEVREVLEEAVAQLLGLVELAGVNQVDGVIGHFVEPPAFVIHDRSPAAAGSGPAPQKGRFFVLGAPSAPANGIRSPEALLDSDLTTRNLSA